MKGIYEALLLDGQRVVTYHGNNIWPEISDVSRVPFTQDILNKRLDRLSSESYFSQLHKLDNSVFSSAVKYFDSIGAEWCNLPLTTLMISSPGEVYAGKTLDYTTDTLPVELSWFNSDKRIFLSESSQFYLEMRLLSEGIDRVFSIYNSFRKEGADFSHLSEFQHIEFEGHVDFKKNIEIAQELLHQIAQQTIVKNEALLNLTRPEEDLTVLVDSFAKDKIPVLRFSDALRILREDTKSDRYIDFSLKNFGAWEEVRLTQILGSHVWLTHYPVLEIPFYHRAMKDSESGIPVAENADLILLGGREVVGAGVRMSDSEALKEKAKVFNLPPEDYDPYLAMRSNPSYRESAGFGLGWQRLTQWLMRCPLIWETCHVPRGHLIPRP